MDKNVPPPPAGFMSPPTAATVIVHQAQLGSESQAMTCPTCHANISTRIETSASTKTHLWALVLCLCGCCLCAPCPYCTNSCLAKKHYCPSCNAYLGQYDN